MKTFVDIWVEEQRERERYFKDPLRYARKIKKIAKEILKDVRVYLFGSAVKGTLKPNSDIDLLIVSPSINRKRESEIRVRVYKKFGLLDPFEIHIVKPEVYEGWYKNFIKNDFLII